MKAIRKNDPTRAKKGRIFEVVAVAGKNPLVNAIRHTIERLEQDKVGTDDDSALAKLKDTLVRRIVGRDDAPPATINDLIARPHE